MPQLLLVIDADATLLDLLSTNLSMAGYGCLLASDAGTALDLVSTQEPGLIISEACLPGLDNWSIIERIRRISSCGLIVLTRLSDEQDKLWGFHLGIDDYITKPFSFAELVARVGAVLKRLQARGPATQLLQHSQIAVNVDQQVVTRRGERLALNRTEYRLLRALVRHSPRPVANAELIREVWGNSYLRSPDQIKHYIWRLRRKLEDDPHHPRHILTVHGIGYRFE